MNILAMLYCDPGSAILLNGVFQTANREIGAPGLFYKSLPPAWEQNKIGASSRERTECRIA
jgi:hypothetical protein